MNDKEEIVRKNYPDHDREENTKEFYEWMRRSKEVFDSRTACKLADKWQDEVSIRYNPPTDEERENLKKLYERYNDLRSAYYRDYITPFGR